MNRGRLSVFLGLGWIIAASASPAFADEFGRFEGNVQTEWLDLVGDHRRMRLLSDFAYVDPNGLEWEAPNGWIIDGASIPKIFWTAVGSPFEGPYRRASVIHDVACDQKIRPWQAVHRTFYNAMRAEGLGAIKAKIMYAAVYAGGPRWETRLSQVVKAADAPEVAAAMMRSVPDGYRTASLRIATVASDYEVGVAPAPSPPVQPTPAPAPAPEGWAGTEVMLVVEEIAPRELGQEDVDILTSRINAEPDISLEEIERLAADIAR